MRVIFVLFALVFVVVLAKTEGFVILVPEEYEEHQRFPRFLGGRGGRRGPVEATRVSSQHDPEYFVYGQYGERDAFVRPQSNIYEADVRKNANGLQADVPALLKSLGLGS